MTHCACRSRARAGHPTVTWPVTSTCLRDRWGRVEARQTALGEALVMRRRTRVRFPPPPPRGLGEMPGSSWRKPGPPRTAVAPASSCLGGLRTHRQHFRDPSPRRVLPRLVYAGLSRVTQVWLAGEPGDAVGGRQTAAEPLRCQMRPVSWAHMASSTGFRAPSLRMRLARWALTVLGVMQSSLGISSLARPWATGTRTSSSRAVSGSIEAPLPPGTSRPVLRPGPSPAAPGPGHSRVEARPTTSGVRWWPSDQPRQPACSGYRPKVQELGRANGQVGSGSEADVPAAGIRDGGSTHPIESRSLVMTTPRSRSALEDLRMPVQAKLAAAWTSSMFLYIYVDFLALYKPGTVHDILAGYMWKFQVSQTLVTIALASMAVPALMIVLSVVLPARPNRVVNLVVASVEIPYLAFNLAGGSWLLYYGLGLGLELLLLAFILRSAWTWPRRPTTSP